MTEPTALNRTPPLNAWALTAGLIVANLLVFGYGTHSVMAS